MSIAVSKRVALTDEVQIPQLGLGVFKISDDSMLQRALHVAVEAGYRSFDTAAIYGNEAGVGHFVASSGIPRDELFITTKLWNSEHGYKSTLRAFDQSLQRLGLDYVDLYLIHWPGNSGCVETWRAFEKLYREGRTRAIGVSNFLEHHLDALLSSCDIPPMLNQVEMHPWLQERSLRRYCEQKGIVVEAWAPLARAHFFDTPQIRTLAEKYSKSPAQICIRWGLQQGVVTIPKSSHPRRIQENADVFDFSLSEEDLQTIATLDAGRRTGPDPDAFF